jgi:hypothetical protein
MKLYLTPWTFAGITTVTTFVARFAERDGSAQRRSSSLVVGLDDAHPSGDPRGLEGRSRGHKSLELPQDEAATAMNMCRALFG